MDVTLCTSSILHLSCISLDRYYAIVNQPLLYNDRMTKKVGRRKEEVDRYFLETLQTLLQTAKLVYAVQRVFANSCINQFKD